MTRQAEDLKDFVCPRTCEPCRAGSYAECKRFWRCLQKAQEQKQRQAESQKP